MTVEDYVCMMLAIGAETHLLEREVRFTTFFFWSAGTSPAPVPDCSREVQTIASAEVSAHALV